MHKDTLIWLDSLSSVQNNVTGVGLRLVISLNHAGFEYPNTDELTFTTRQLQVISPENEPWDDSLTSILNSEVLCPPQLFKSYSRNSTLSPWSCIHQDQPQVRFHYALAYSWQAPKESLFSCFGMTLWKSMLFSAPGTILLPAPFKMQTNK